MAMLGVIGSNNFTQMKGDCCSPQVQAFERQEMPHDVI